MKNIFLNTLTVITASAALIIAVTFLFGGRMYAVLSGSMEPAVYTGDAVFVSTSVPFEEIEAGDIICFEAANGTPVIHRALDMSPEGIETKGDANRISDGISTTRENFIGKVLFNIPLAGYVMQFLSAARVRILLITAVAVLLILGFFRPSVSGNRKEEQSL